MIDKTVQPKSIEDARAEFTLRGQSIAEWSRERSFSASLVSDILAGRRKCLRGQSHNIAIALGIKLQATGKADRHHSIESISKTRSNENA